jgi:hypothetical protein
MVAAKTWISKDATKTELVIKLRIRPEAGSVQSHPEGAIEATLDHHNRLEGGQLSSVLVPIESRSTTR